MPANERTTTPTTRRAMFGAALALPVIAALPAMSAGRRAQTEWKAFAIGLSALNPRAPQAIAHAEAAGMKLSDLYCVVNYDEPDRPSLLFHCADGRVRSFSPSGENHHTPLRAS